MKYHNADLLSNKNSETFPRGAISVKIKPNKPTEYVTAQKVRLYKCRKQCQGKHKKKKKGLQQDQKNAEFENESPLGGR